MSRKGMQQPDFSKEVDLGLPKEPVTSHPLICVRQGWEEQFQQMAIAGDDHLIDGDFPLTEWEKTEWA